MGLHTEVRKVTGTKLIEIHRTGLGSIDHVNVVNRSGEILEIFWGETAANRAIDSIGSKGAIRDKV